MNRKTWEIRLSLCKTAADYAELYEFMLYKQFPTLYWGLKEAANLEDPERADSWFWLENSREVMGATLHPVVYWGC